MRALSLYPPGRRRALARSFASARPFKHVVIDDFFAPGFCRRLAKDFPKYDRARFLNEHGDPGKAHHEALRRLGPAFRALDDALRSPAFIGLIEDISGIDGLLFDPSYFGGGTHENLDDMELFPHVDFNCRGGLHRRLNLLIYLNPVWRAEWGGSLQLHENAWPARRDDRVKTVAPLMNRCVMFETTDRSWHGFERLRLPPGERVSRRSIALYLYSKSPAAGVAPIPPDLTMFVDRPLPERFKQAGRALSAEDARELERLVVERDRRIEYLYGRALDWYRRAVRGEAVSGMLDEAAERVRRLRRGRA